MGSAFLLVPWQQYQFDDDLDLLRRHYNGMKRYVIISPAAPPTTSSITGLATGMTLARNPGSRTHTISLTATAFYIYTWFWRIPPRYSATGRSATI